MLLFQVEGKATEEELISICLSGCHTRVLNIMCPPNIPKDRKTKQNIFDIHNQETVTLFFLLIT